MATKTTKAQRKMLDEIKAAEAAGDTMCIDDRRRFATARALRNAGLIALESHTFPYITGRAGTYGRRRISITYELRMLS